MIRDADTSSNFTDDLKPSPLKRFSSLTKPVLRWASVAVALAPLGASFSFSCITKS